MDFFPLTFRDFELFLFVFARVGGVFFFAPILGHRALPVPVRMGLAFFLALLFFPLVREEGFREVTALIPFVLGLAGELAIGLLIGFSAVMVFAAMEMAAELIGFQMGFGIVSVMDPQANQQISIITQFQDLLVFLIFLSLNGHHWFLAALAETFRAVPVLGVTFSGALADHVVALGSQLFTVGLKLAAPVLGALFLANVALGLVARTVPQMNVFVVGFPLTIAVGLLTLLATLAVFGGLVQGLLVGMNRDLTLLIRSLGRGV